MIRILDVSPLTQTHLTLSDYQAEIDAIRSYSQKVKAAKRHFKARNTRTNRTFSQVRVLLDAMCVGARRCAYCEDSMADEVEHIRPKDLYPEEVFDWQNYLYACGPCNGGKRSYFAVFAPTTGRIRDVTRGRNDPVVPPHPGDHVFIDPRSDDPTSFMKLDLISTFFFLPIGNRQSRRYRRADYTISKLKLNSRDALVQARESAFGSFKARLVEYCGQKNNGATVVQLRRLMQGVRDMHHQTVWHEMKRQHSHHPGLTPLFQAAPEALLW